MDITEIKRRVSEKLGEKRLRHTEGVVATAVELAARNGFDPRKAELAAWLHDCAKWMTIDEQLAYAAEKKVFLSEDDYVSKGVIHGRIGARMAEEEYGVHDRDVLFAIYYHSTGHARMNAFHKVLMASDYLEPGRVFDFRQTLLDEVYADFEAGMFSVIRNRLAYIVGKGDPVHPDSVGFYNAQLALVKKQEKK